jgi:DNA helicase-2/ATP-dependent DNA helicase PcrA
MTSIVVEPNKDQINFAQNQNPYIRLLAPAGCGKTYSLLLRCKKIIENAKDDHIKILLFTFTKVARDEIISRLMQDLNFKKYSNHITVTTLNAWGFRRLKNIKRNIKLINSKKDRYFCINNLLQSDWMEYSHLREVLENGRQRYQASYDLMDIIDIFKSLGFIHTNEIYFKEQFKNLKEMGIFEYFLNSLDPLYALNILNNKNNYEKEILNNFFPFWSRACEKMYNSSIFTFEDQKYWPFLDLKNQIESQKNVYGNARLTHIFIDEFQDINPLDLYLLKSIIQVNRSSITIVGDDDQAIYEWRGASPKFILEPEKFFKVNFQTFILQTNYRSPQNIVQCSQKLISNNINRVHKKMDSYSTKDAEIKIWQFNDITETFQFVTQYITTNIKLNKINKNNKIAIIGRKKSQIIPYQIIFAKENIPFHAAEDLHIFLSNTFKELQEILKIKITSKLPSYLSNPIENIIKLCDKIKKYPLSKIEKDSIVKYLRKLNPKNLLEASQFLLNYDGKIKQDNSGRIAKDFALNIQLLIASETVSETIEILSNFEGFQKDYGKSKDDIFYTDPPFLYLSNMAKIYKSDYENFLNDIDTAINNLSYLSPDEQEDEEINDSALLHPVHLMTALRAKGKEYNTVIVLDANNDIWPSRLASTQEQQEQERRLFYVVMTRAKQELIFIVNKQINLNNVEPSPYLKEIGFDI